ncbi:MULTISPECIES: ABC transporter ATP-binding protein [unclassified Paracoccus (in: a-proteobacteria)]|uniref:ABC transporter ATP-binding protein n=1 Tax=unclassified Paracoccus (in: a-proteobacteria) TaxID=2688777 RepID=UPI0012B3448F|nr:MULTISPECIES: ABC transporter ATP-binding protein [unclassified Paracoccus (in: a-proteobacteria)]UXU75718.1 ABC transporter ATP-binding protein [Paracoccus sp. SMMA_5]UXU81624.1 ABC transporter ATP-binding protein [Paracoccus sp. SMMA_5_TC]
MMARVRGRAWVGDQPLFAPLDLQLRSGEWTCLLGPSGVGKSTLLRLLAGLETGARFEGEVIRDQPAALMAQDAGLIPWLDVTGNVALGARLRGEARAPDALRRALALIAAVGLQDRAHHLPAELSGGQRQRVALARTLFEDRPLVLLDEPFSALDTRTRAQMQDLAAALLRDRSVLLVTHDPAEAARLGDRILLLRESGLTEWSVELPRPPGGARPYDAPEVLALQADLMRGMMA